MQGIEIGEEFLLPTVLSLLALWLARSLGFFVLPSEDNRTYWPRIHFWQVVSVFAIYLSCALFIPLLAANSFDYFFPYTAIDSATPGSKAGVLRTAYIQVIVLASSALLLFLFCLLQRDSKSMRYVWKQPCTPPSSIGLDFGVGVIAWLISFPVVTVIGILADLIVNFIYGPQQYEQVAVRFLKTSLDSQLLFVLALGTIVLVAPILEEFLFRGFLQNFLKRHIGRKAAILVTAFVFALFHFSHSQHLGNAPLVATLFVLALFLGFVYERQQSLFASIGLHMTFNTISVLRIVLTPEA